MQYNKMKYAVGIFVLILIFSISASLFFLLKEKGTFDTRYNFYFNTKSASAFKVGMPLNISGFNIGRIDNITLKDDGTVQITFSVNKENRKWISQESILSLKKPLIGSPYIDIYSKVGNPPLAVGSTLNILMSNDINDIISKLVPVMESIIHVINNVDKITSYLAQENSDLMQTLLNIKKFSAKLARDESLLTTITGDQNSTKTLVHALGTSDSIMTNINKATKNISITTKSLDEKIVNPSSATIQDIEDIMKDIKEKLHTLDGTIKAIGGYDKDLVALKEQVSVGITKSNLILDKIDSLLQDEKKSEIKLP